MATQYRPMPDSAQRLAADVHQLVDVWATLQNGDRLPALAGPMREVRVSLEMFHADEETDAPVPTAAVASPSIHAANPVPVTAYTENVGALITAAARFVEGWDRGGSIDDTDVANVDALRAALAAVTVPA